MDLQVSAQPPAGTAGSVNFCSHSGECCGSRGSVDGWTGNRSLKVGPHDRQGTNVHDVE